MARVLLAEHDGPLARSVLHVLSKVAVLGEWVRSGAELAEWAARPHEEHPSLVLLDWELPGAAAGEPLGALSRLWAASSIVVLSEGLSGDDAAVLLSRGVPSIRKPVNPFVLSMLALGLCTESSLASPDRQGGVPLSVPLQVLPDAGGRFDDLFAAYAASRRLSKQQSLILDLYLNGKTDKEIAELCACSGATVYEHWRRMARKSGGRQKSDLIADFHRFLRNPPESPVSVPTLDPM